MFLLNVKADMKKLLFLWMPVMLVLGSCQDNQYPVYSSDNYIYFEKDSNEMTVYSFFFTEAKEADIKLALKIVAPVVGENRSYGVRFVAEESTAKPGVDFKAFDVMQTFGANLTVDTLTITLQKAETLEKGDEVKAVFELYPAGDFVPGFPDRVKAVVLISDKVSRPAWWDEWHETSGLGTYSDTKYRLFAQWTGVSDLDFKNREDLTQSDVRALVLQFKYMLKENPQEDENGPMSVAMRG